MAPWPRSPVWLLTFSLSRAVSGWAVCPSPSVFPSLVVVVFAAAVLLQGVAAQGAQQDAPLAVPPALEPERDVPRVAQYVVQAARLAPDALRAARSDALLGAPQVLGELLAAHWDALRADLRAAPAGWRSRHSRVGRHTWQGPPDIVQDSLITCFATTK